MRHGTYLHRTGRSLILDRMGPYVHRVGTHLVGIELVPISCGSDWYPFHVVLTIALLDRIGTPQAGGTSRATRANPTTTCGR